MSNYFFWHNDENGVFGQTLNSFDAYIKALNAGIAVSYLHDDIGRGTLKTDRINLFENKLKISPSLQVSYFRKYLDVQNLHFGGVLTQDGDLCGVTPELFPELISLTST